MLPSPGNKWKVLYWSIGKAGVLLFMDIVKTATLVLICGLAVVAGWAFIVSEQIERSILDAGFYADLMEEADIPVILHAQILDSLREEMLEGAPPDAADAFVSSLGTALEPRWIGEQMNVVIRDMVAFISGEQESLTAVIDLHEVKERFRHELNTAIAELPDEYRDDLDFLDDPDAEPGDLLDAIDMPDHLILEEFWQNGDGALGEVASRIQRYRRYLRWFSLTVLIILIVLTCLLVGPGHGLQWFGGATILSGLLFALALWLTGFVLSPRFAEFDFVTAADFADIPWLMTAVEFTVNRLYAAPIMYSGIGLIVLVAGLVVTRIRPRTSNRTG